MSRRRSWLIPSAVAVGVIVAVAVTVSLALRDRATPVSAEEITGDSIVVENQPGGAGLYVYDTVGFETTTALGGRRHDYPTETFLTLQPGRCGSVMRWQALEERWDTWDTCEGPRLAAWESYHEWFGVGNLDEWQCSSPIPFIGTADETWTGACTTDTSTETMTLEAIGTETMDIGGTPVDAIHIRITTEMAGTTNGTSRTDLWIMENSPLVVRRVVDRTSTTESRIGPVDYHEEYVAVLQSVVPRS